MGVRGLTTFVNNNQDAFLKTFKLHDSYLVVDGFSLSSQLYLRLNCFSAFGGDYDKYSVYVKNFFKTLKKCNVSCFVLFDGGLESRKLKTCFRRLKTKICGASKLDPVSQSHIPIFPLALRGVFIQAMFELDIPCMACEFEADDEVAALAKHLNCPVLSYDSDYFIYNVQYIPINSIDVKAKFMKIDDQKIFYLDTKIFKVEYFMKNFNLTIEVLPVLGTLLGNDYVQKKTFKKFLSQLKTSKSSKYKNAEQKCIYSVIHWLQNETLESAVSKIIGHVKKKQKKFVLFALNKGINGYNCIECRALKHFNLVSNVTDKIKQIEHLTCDNIDKEDEEGDESSSKSEDDEIESSEDESHKLEIAYLENWLLDKIHNFKIPLPYIKLYTHHLYFCSPQAEDYSDEDAMTPALSILRYAFDILTDFKEESFTYLQRDGFYSYKRKYIEKDSSIKPPITHYPKATEEELKCYFHHFVTQYLNAIDMTVFEHLPIDFHMVYLSILWWIKYCPVTKNIAYSLLLSYIMLNVVDEKTGIFRGHHFFMQTHSKKLEEIQKREIKEDSNEFQPCFNKNKVSYDDCVFTCSLFLKHFELSDVIKKKPKSYDTKCMHLLSQFQCCLQQLNFLNILCCNAYTSTNLSKFYNGTFIYNIAMEINKQDPIKFVEKLLVYAPSIVKFYKGLCMLLENNISCLGLGFKEISHKKRKRNEKQSDRDRVNILAELLEFEVTI